MCSGNRWLIGYPGRRGYILRRMLLLNVSVYQSLDLHLDWYARGLINFRRLIVCSSDNMSCVVIWKARAYLRHCEMLGASTPSMSRKRTQATLHRIPVSIVSLSRKKCYLA